MASNTQFCNRSGSWENKKLKKKYFIYSFLLTCAVQFVLPFLHNGFGHFILSNMQVIGSLGIRHYDQLIEVIMDLGMC